MPFIRTVYSYVKAIFDWIFPQHADDATLRSLTLADVLSQCAHREIQTELDISVHVIGSYKTPILQSALHGLKYRNHRHIASLLGQALYEILAEQLSEWALLENLSQPLVIPIPLSTAKHRSRGFNQSEHIARAFVEALGSDYTLCVDGLARINNTKSQARTTTREERLENIRGCFTVSNPERIRGRNIILIDDVTTTGATLHEACRELRSAGAHTIYCIAIAH